nr:MAG: hypothetical protein DIU57_19735 [Pseudomonadota bacterium]
MKAAAVLMLALLPLSGCVSTPAQPETPQPLPRAKPSECLQACRVNSCTLPHWFDQATLEDQAALLLNCSIVNAYEARECARRQGCLAEWISEE